MLVPFQRSLTSAASRSASRVPKPAMWIPAFTSFSTETSYVNILTSVKDQVALITLNRPKALNALNTDLANELSDAVSKFDADPNVAAVVITGSERAFAAGADIPEMAPQSFAQMYSGSLFKGIDDLRKAKKPLIAAVNGYALGGGCELAMTCDIILAGDRAIFGQPEIKLGTIPGIGGTQRLTRAIGKSRAMELCLTGDNMTAEEAAARGLVSRVIPAADLVDEALAVGKKIAAFSKPVAALTKEAVNQSYESSLEEGLHFERRLFHSTFATNDQKEGMKAFVEKRQAHFTDS